MAFSFDGYGARQLFPIQANRKGRPSFWNSAWSCNEPDAISPEHAPDDFATTEIVIW